MPRKRKLLVMETGRSRVKDALHRAKNPCERAIDVFVIAVYDDGGSETFSSMTDETKVYYLSLYQHAIVQRIHEKYKVEGQR